MFPIMTKTDHQAAFLQGIPCAGVCNRTLAVRSLRLAKAPGGRSGTRESGAGTVLAALVGSGVSRLNAKYRITCAPTNECICPGTRTIDPMQASITVRLSSHNNDRNGSRLLHNCAVLS